MQMSSPRRKVKLCHDDYTRHCQHVHNGEMFYHVIIVTVMKEKFSVRRRGMGRRRRSRLYEHLLAGISPHENFESLNENVGVHLLLFLLSPLPLLREERTSDPEIPTRRCGYWTYFFKANWDEPRWGSMKNFSCQDYITILYIIHGTLSLNLYLK